MAKALVIPSNALLFCSLVLTACGGGAQQGEPPKTAHSAVLPNLPPPLPRDPLQLLPETPRDLLSIDLRELRASPHWGSVERWLRRFACLQAEPSHFLLERTERAVLASYAAGPNGEPLQPLVVLQGDYRDGDVERALAQGRALFGEAAAATTQQPRGRFVVFNAGELAGAQLGDHLIAIGHPARVLAALDVADAKAAAFHSTQELVRGVDTDEWLSKHSAAALTRVDERTARRLGKQLSVIGGRKLGENLTESSAAVSLVLAGDLRMQAYVEYPDARTAADAADGLHSVLGRAELVLRLTGLPSALEHIEVGVDGPRLSATLKLSSAELQRLNDRLMPMLDQGTPACGALSSAPSDTPIQAEARHAHK